MFVLLHMLAVFRETERDTRVRKRPVFRGTGRKKSAVHSAGCANPAVLEQHKTPSIRTICGGRLIVVQRNRHAV